MTISIFIIIYQYACRRIWSAKGMFGFEIFSWTIAAVYVGLSTFGLLKNQDEFLMFAGHKFVVCLTPIVIGTAIWRAHTSVGIGDEGLRNVPLNSFQILVPRMMSVLLSWFRMTVPWLVFIAGPGYRFLTGISWGFFRGLTELLKYQLVIFPDRAMVPLTEVLPPHPPPWHTPFVYSLGTLQCIGWIVLPLTWGFLWGAVFNKRPGHFFFVYILYLLIPGIHALIIYNEWYTKLFGYDNRFLSIATISGLGWIVFSILFFALTLVIRGRRSG